MKRRDFVKTSLCLSCAGALGVGAMLCKKEGITSLSDIETFLAERKFLYRSVKDLPKKIRLDVCNLCQLKCPVCWVRRDEEIIKKDFGGFGYVSFETFKKFLDENQSIKEIELAHYGEILLNPDLEDIVRYSYEKGVTLTANAGVNMNYLPEKLAEALVKYNFNSMTVAMDGATQDIYSIYRKGGNLDTVIHNIKTINKYKEKYNTRYPMMVYKVILFGHNVHQIEKSRELAKELNMPIWFVVNAIEGYSPFKQDDRAKVTEATGISTLDSEIETVAEQYRTGKQNFCFCTDIYENPQINYNGDLWGCSVPYLKSFGINVFKDGLLKALNNEKVLHTKLILSDFSVEPREDTPCKGCYFYDEIKKKNIPIKQFNNILKI